MKIKCPENLVGSAGMIGPVWFDECGVSAEISAEEARRFIAVFGGEALDGVATDMGSLDAAVVRERAVLEEAASAEFYERMKFRHDVAPAVRAQAAKRQGEAPAGEHTRESLGALADQGGIKAVREIGVKFGVTNKSLVGLIDDILEAQARAE